MIKLALLTLGLVAVAAQDLPVFQINLDLPPRERFAAPTLRMKDSILKAYDAFN